MIKTSNAGIVFILGALATLSPVAIDLYLPAFPQIANEFGTSPSRIALSLSSYFIGLSIGQLFYGPLLDRYGRKPPLLAGLTLFAAASLGCLTASSVEALVALRFLQALGGCAASVGATAMVRDFFPPKQGAKIFSLLILILSVSPLLAPTVGGFVSTHFGWRYTFLLLTVFSLGLAAVCHFLLPEGQIPDKSVSLHPGKALATYWQVLKQPQFFTYAVTGALSFAGLFAYVAGSPVIFLDLFGLSANQYGMVFALISTGLIGSAQLNILVMKRFTSEQIFFAALCAQILLSAALFAGGYLNQLSLIPTVALMFLFLSSIGFSNPNAAGLALAPFTTNVGSASALMGFLQIGAGALASGVIGTFALRSTLPMVATLFGTVLLAWALFLFGRGRITRPVPASEVAVASH